MNNLSILAFKRRLADVLEQVTNGRMDARFTLRFYNLDDIATELRLTLVRLGECMD
jgi:hypothetical protein